jgi:hypothetical protein
MALRGPRSTAELTLITMPDRMELEPPADMGSEASGIFRELVKSCKPGHFRPVDRHLLATLANVIAAGKHHARQGQHKEWLQCCTLQMQLSVKLRLTPSSRYDARASERTTRVSGQAAPWEGYGINPLTGELDRSKLKGVKDIDMGDNPKDET